MDFNRIDIFHWFVVCIAIHLVGGAGIVLQSNDYHALTTVESFTTSTATATADVAVTPPSSTTTPTIRSIESSICDIGTDYFVRENGKESSVTLNLKPSSSGYNGQCSLTLTAPATYSFVVKFNRLKSKSLRNSSSGGVYNSTVIPDNRTQSCPLKIYTSADAFVPPWTLDPCQTEGHGHREQVRLTDGHISITWKPSNFPTKYNLIVTTLGKGEQCKSGNKHPCLKIGQDTVFCVSSSLACDGVNHCPPGELYISDEDADMCSKQNSIFEKNKPSLNLLQQLSEFIKNHLPLSVQSVKAVSGNSADEILHPLEDEDIVDDSSADTVPTKPQRKNTRGLSKYGPWGYCVLGMMLCGGTLILCVLWECCCRTNKDPLVTMESNISTVAGNNYLSNQADTTLPPNYDDLDPPPSYSVLFPRNKAESSPSATDVSLLSSAATATSLSSLPSNLPSSNDDYRTIPLTPSDSVLPN